MVVSNRLSKWELLVEEYERLDEKLGNIDFFSTTLTSATRNKIKLLIKGRMKTLLTKINELEKEVD